MSKYFWKETNEERAPGAIPGFGQQFYTQYYWKKIWKTIQYSILYKIKSSYFQIQSDNKLIEPCFCTF